mgnify:CR=1 FL=1
MPTFERCDKSVEELAKALIDEYPSHGPLAKCEVKIDFVFARADKDDEGRILNHALIKNGIPALGIARKLSLKDRALGRGDAEIALDGDWWVDASAEEQAALLDHELHHVAVKADKSGNPQFDDLGRPQIKLRKHDVEFGFFNIIAERHGIASQERIQAKAIMDQYGQFYWPELATTVQITAGDFTSKPMSVGAFAKLGSTKI